MRFIRFLFPGFRRYFPPLFGNNLKKQDIIENAMIQSIVEHFFSTAYGYPHDAVLTHSAATLLNYKNICLNCH